MPAQPKNITVTILSIVFYTLIAFLCIGLPIAVLPGYVHDQLGFSPVVAGLVIGAQYLATLLIRPLAGRLADSVGTKKIITWGLYGIVGSGALTLLSTLLQSLPVPSLVPLLLGRLLLGCSQGMIGVGTASWGIGAVGAENTARVISWNGIASYGAIAFGAPLGVVLTAALGYNVLGPLLMLMAAGGLLVLRKQPSMPVVRGERMPFWAAFAKVAPYGLALTLASIGYGTLTTFVTLYYGENAWEGAAFCLTAFGISFVAARLIFVNAINHYGAFASALACMAVETLGFVLLWLAPSPGWALAGASLTGFGLSLVYPALGVIAIRQVPSASRGAGLGAFAVFFDMALATAGPLMGALATLTGYGPIFLVAAGLSLAGLGIVAMLGRRAR
ncbi:MULTISPECIES: MFS transporter [unclassified Pseudomonas]|uniref:MFS transporter n=1 Tax=unclassified Pseudomonas TaxID=196821 RepID=UPI000BDBA47F|nr:MULTISPECIES: MFS transporter [unclassified Pseudomonas]PVZ19493.1 putative MFS family arabinose efflux permease [Pseudomonas sp. URIL14HWK12:I12]PVZ22922.1 putative MFS family arabinose efflux permease [Pseudomonas sp. URIL14HWK12:I10]PVZ37448.1 putative MFS family arabinose efflux permease [Pseudomonas sp. URIL14HWK12:I11]SNZ14814.1 Predicted arabinose efflux permease, MFS family [Pseudomonas sp. URIL14HWK12:I9]